ncbi:peptidoglycan editing factor PgeF [Pelagibius sp.]|uniref:peptidoglycan editing factor PgeF n=1 Tax=Pelagibius sp. TaxID=1931238 RepID=UPI003BAA8BAE
MLTVAALNDTATVRHGFFSRNGGVSEGLFASLNCGYGSGDAAEHVTENRRRAMARIDLEDARLVTAYQVHSPDVVEVREPWRREDAPRADAMVTRQRGVALGILTADCVPVLLADPEAGVIGAAHAGWKGALTGVLEATVAAMAALGARPAAVLAGIGPAISQRSYEVGPEFPRPFLEQDSRNADFFCPGQRSGHFHFDLKGYVARRLAGAGLTAIQTLPCDTCAEDGRFFSYRRACLRKEPDYGRGLSAIYLES